MWPETRTTCQKVSELGAGFSANPKRAWFLGAAWSGRRAA